MTLADNPVLGRAAALAILAGLIVAFCLGPLAAYVDLLLGVNGDGACAGQAALLQRYQALSVTGPRAPAHRPSRRCSTPTCRNRRPRPCCRKW